MIRHGYCPTCGSFSAESSYIPPGSVPYGERDRLTDEDLARRVHEALAQNPELELSTLHLTVLNGIVTISGQIPNKRLKQRVAEQILAMPEVIDVFNHLVVALAKR